METEKDNTAKRLVEYLEANANATRANYDDLCGLSIGHSKGFYAKEETKNPNTDEEEVAGE